MIRLYEIIFLKDHERMKSHTHLFNVTMYNDIGKNYSKNILKLQQLELVIIYHSVLFIDSKHSSR